jgi:Flp pilus assembly protein TadG
MTPSAAPCSRPRFTLRRLAHDHRGLAAIEFALTCPILLMFYLGATELVEAITVKRLTVLTAHTVANLVTQYSSVSQSRDLPDILAAASTVLTPYSVNNATVTVSEVSIDSNKNATITWSQALVQGAQQQGRPVGQAVTGIVPDSLRIANTCLIWGETTYSFTAAVDWMHFGTFNLYSSVFMSPRLSPNIPLNP